MATTEIIPMLKMTNSHFPDIVTERSDAKKSNRRPRAQKIVKVVFLCLSFAAIFIFLKMGKLYVSTSVITFFLDIKMGQI